MKKDRDAHFIKNYISDCATNHPEVEVLLRCRQNRSPNLLLSSFPSILSKLSMRYCVMKGGGEEGSEGKRRVMRETEVGKVISFPSCRVMDGRREGRRVVVSRRRGVANVTLEGGQVKMTVSEGLT